MSTSRQHERRELLKAVYEEARGCERCPLHQTRTTVVFGAGNADAELMFIGEAPGRQRGSAWACRSSARPASCSTSCSARSGSSAGRCSSPTCCKCRPPDNRDPHPNEIEACQDYLCRQVELIEPTVICTLGNFSTKLLRGDTDRDLAAPRPRGGAADRASRRPAVPAVPPCGGAVHAVDARDTAGDFQRIPELLALGAPEQPELLDELPELDEGDAFGGTDDAPSAAEPREPEPAPQLGLF